jgi:hypothetical protein
MDTTPSPLTPVSNTDDKKQHRREYMREYKRKQYQENSEKIKLKNQAYYYKYKFNRPTEDMKKYDVLLPYIAKLEKIINDLKSLDSVIAKEFLESKYKELSE